MSSITIAIPSKGTCDPAFAVALRLLNIPFDQIQVLQVSGADVDYARNLLVEKALGDYIFFLDDDTLPPINAITKLKECNQDIVSGLYFSKQEPHFPQIFYKNKEKNELYDTIGDYQKDQLIEVDACGAGCLLIKKEVFKKIKQPYFNYIPSGEKTNRKGEDYYFCEQAKKAGYKIYCDTSIICGHLGTKVVGPDHWEISRQRLLDIEKQMGPEKFKEWRNQFIK
jgi:glycosyltransferase involved in cell wall biosynthesis